MIEPSEAADAAARAVVDAALVVHRALGPGLLESVYEHCLTHELSERGVEVKRQVAMPVAYRGMRLDAGFRVDLVVGDRVLVEIKAVERLLPVHEAQVLTYMKLSGREVGLLLNFNVVLLKQGIRRLVRAG
jgi:GxxExxY protein